MAKGEESEMPSNRTGVVIAWGVCIASAIALAACAPPSTPQGPRGQMMGGAATPQTSQPTTSTGQGSSSSTGERIWLTGAGASGQQIARTAPRTSNGALMMGGGGCASCHGRNGRGGTTRMMMGRAIKAPDVTYGALVKEGFTAETVSRAITQGLDESGKPLDEAMPRWQMNAGDLDATIEYLKVLGAQ
jgi:cytochrome c oxidase subunit II